MLEETDYQQLLTDLEQERENIERMIAWVKGRMGQADSAQAVPLSATVTQPAPKPIMRFPRLAQDSFFRMSVPQAITAFLNIVKRPQTAKDITAALESGGLTHQAKNLYATVYPTLIRMEGSGDVARVGKGQWGLAEWYPGGRKSASDKQATGETNGG